MILRQTVVKILLTSSTYFKQATGRSDAGISLENGFYLSKGMILIWSWLSFEFLCNLIPRRNDVSSERYQNSIEIIDVFKSK